MTRSIALAGVIAALCALPAAAQQATGGSLTVSHSAFTEDTGVSKTAVVGSVEIGFAREFSIQGDLGFGRLANSGETATNLGLHGIYHLSQNTSAGLFMGVDRLGGDNTQLAGLELGHQAGRTGFEAYVGRAEDNGSSVTMLGMSSRYAVTPSAGVGLSFDHGSYGAFDATRYSLNGDMALGENFRVFGELGAVDAAAGGLSGSETYLKLGGKITFGAKRGTTFGQRSLINLLPGG